MTQTPPGAEACALPGGVRVVTEHVPGARSAAFGIWVGVGSRDEEPAEAGASHFLEHLLFKGTERRSALEIASVMDAVGGELNAFTAHEYTCYYARVLDTDLPLAVDVVTDLVTCALVADEDVEVERGVILEEISMHDDDPGDVVHEVFAQALYGDHPLGRPVIGSVAGIEALPAQTIQDYYRGRYQPSRMVVSAVGNVDHQAVVDQVAQAFGGSAVPEGLRPRTAVPTRSAALVDARATEQAHLVLGVEGLARHDERRFAMAVLNSALGGGMSSRLFQEVRERRALAYSVYSFHSEHHDTGSFGVYAGCAPGKVDEVLAVCREELGAAADRGLTEAEVVRAKGQLAGAFVLGLEDSGSIMSRIGKSLLVHGDVLSVDELLARIKAVTVDDVRDLAAEVLRRPPALGIIGPFPDRDFTEALR